MARHRNRRARTADFLEAGDSFSSDEYTPVGLQEANHRTEKLQLALEIARRL